MTALRVGMVGLGTVGTGVARLLTAQGGRLERRAGRRIELRKVAVRDRRRRREIELPADMLCDDPLAVVNNPDVDVVVELMGGTDAARRVVLAALDAGVSSFESSFGELGGCPVPKGATGNVATEDVLSMLHEMGIETGVSLDALLEASRTAQEVLGRPLGSHLLTAGPVVWNG